MTITHERIVQAMKRRNLSPEMLSIKTGRAISARMIRYYRIGRHQPSGESLVLLSKGLGVTVDWLLGIDEKEEQA